MAGRKTTSRIPVDWAKCKEKDEEEEEGTWIGILHGEDGLLQVPIFQVPSGVPSTQAPAFRTVGPTPAFGASCPTPVFCGSSTTQAVGATSQAPAFGAASQTPAFGATSQTPAFGSANQTPAFGSATPSFDGAKEKIPKLPEPSINYPGNNATNQQPLKKVEDDTEKRSSLKGQVQQRKARSCQKETGVSQEEPRGNVYDCHKKSDKNLYLWHACNDGELGKVVQLVNDGADIDSQNKQKVSCLMAALMNGHKQVVQWIIEHMKQFPSEKELSKLSKHIASITDKELQIKCQQCKKIIVSAKECKTAEANKNEKDLLEELDKEKQEEEIRKGAAAEKRERKKKRKEEKQMSKLGSKKVPVPTSALSLVSCQGDINTIREFSGAVIKIPENKGSGKRTITIEGSAEEKRQPHELTTALIADPDKELNKVISEARQKPPSGNVMPASGATSHSNRTSQQKTSVETQASRLQQSVMTSGNVTSSKHFHDGRHKRIRIEGNSTGHSYWRLFGKYIKNVTEVTVEDPYIRYKHQIDNFSHFCGLMTSTVKIKKIELITGQDKDINQRKFQERKLSELSKRLQSHHRVDLEIKYSKTLHDREISFSNGWIIKIGRGLDIYKTTKGKYLSRKCLETRVDIFHSSTTTTI